MVFDVSAFDIMAVEVVAFGIAVLDALQMSFIMDKVASRMDIYFAIIASGLFGK